MKRYVIRRLLMAIPLLLAISFVCFVFINMIPSNPAEVVLRIQQTPIITEEAIAEMEEALGLNKPFLVRYFDWVLGCLQGDFGISYVNPARTVAGELARCLPATLQLAAASFVIVLVLSASMSTLSSLVLTSSSTLTLDLLKDNVGKNMSEKKQLVYMRVLIVVFIVISAVIALVQYNSSITFIAQLMSISWGALAGSFLGPFFWGLYSRRVSRPAVWASFIVGVGLTTGNMIAGFVGTAFIASPINCGAIAMVLSLIIVPVVSLFTKRVEFEVDPPHVEGAIDREYEQELEAE